MRITSVTLVGPVCFALAGFIVPVERVAVVLEEPGVDLFDGFAHGDACPLYRKMMWHKLGGSARRALLASAERPSEEHVQRVAPRQNRHDRRATDAELS